MVNQLKVSGARCIFTDNERLPTVLKAAKQLKIGAESIYLINNGTKAAAEAGVRNLEELLDYGELQWERINDLSVVSERFVSSMISTVRNNK